MSEPWGVLVPLGPVLLLVASEAVRLSIRAHRRHRLSGIHHAAHREASR